MLYAMGKDPNVLPSQLVGKPAPSFLAQTAQGGQLDLSAQLSKGRWVIMNFWSTTCVVCRHEAPELEGFYRQSLGDSTGRFPLFVSVNIKETVPEVLGYQKDFSLSFPVVLDVSGKIALDFGVTGTPETFFIDPSGKVRHRVAGDVDRDTILRFIDWLEKNPDRGAREVLDGYFAVRKNRI